MDVESRHVFTLSYMRPTADGRWEGQLIGVYSSLGEAEKAQERLRHRTSYRDYPEGFWVDCLRLDQDYDEHPFKLFDFPAEE